jgi:lactoylglutathione lyase
MRLGYVILYVPDVDATLSFYETVFGLKRRFLHDSGQYGELDTGATALAFAAEALVETTCHEFRRNRPSETPAGAEVAFVVEDVQAAYDGAVSKGATALVAPLQKPWGQTIAYVRDCNGFLVELCSEVCG